MYRSALASKLAYAHPLFAPPSQTRQQKHSADALVLMHTPGLVVVRTGEDALLVAFKGSTTMHDIARFLRMSPTEFRFREASVMVHGGVLEMFNAVQEPLYDALPIHTLRHGRYKTRASLTFTGHSQGGSLALFASAYFGSLTHNNLDISCHTFGTPRVGDAAFHAWQAAHTKETVHVIHPMDVVPKIPVGFGYVQNPNSVLVRAQRGEADHMTKPPTLSDVLGEHDMDAYLETMRRKTHEIEIVHSPSADAPTRSSRPPPS